MAKETLWKFHKVYKEDGKIIEEELINCDDGFCAAVELMNIREYDMNRADKSAVFKYTNDNGIESWRYECEDYVREATIYPVEIEKETPWQCNVSRKNNQ